MLYKKKILILLIILSLQTFLISALSIEVNSPTNSYYKTNQIVINATFEDLNKIDTIWIEAELINSTFKIAGESSVKNILIKQNFPEGSHNITFYFNNTIGESLSKKILFTIDKTLPQIDETTNLCSFEYQDVMLNVSIQDKNPKTAWISGNWEGSWKNYSPICLNVTSQLQKCSYRVRSDLLESGEIFNWKYYSEDMAGNVKEGLLKSYEVEHSTDLRIIPDLPNGLNNWYITEPNFVLTNPDANKVYYKWDAGSYFEYESQFNLEKSPNDGNKTGGIFRLTWKGETDCGLEKEQNKIIYVDLTGPIITKLMPEPESENNEYRPIIQGYVKKMYSSTSEINVQSIIMRMDNFIVPASIKTMNNQNILVNYTADQDLSVGKHTVSIYAKDQAGRDVIVNWSFYVNPITLFDLIINTPEDSLYSSKKIPINITSTKNITEIRYINLDNNSPRWTVLCKNCNSYGEKYKKTISGNEGWNNLIIVGIDEFGNEKEKDLRVYVDSKSPKIITTQPIKNKFSNGSDFYVKYIETDLSEIIASYGNYELGFETKNVYDQCNESGRNVLCNFKLELTKYENKDIYYWVNISDKLRSVKSKDVMIKVDTKKPVITINSPQIDNNYSRRVLFDVMINEQIKRLELFDSTFPTKWKSLCLNCERVSKIQYMKTGLHNVTLKATDYAGNYEEKTISFYVD
ncbi:MAG TPA: hypothetical protein P5277_02220 [Candidatus Paceibacterota bacterium]|nr:hypothetical protein [Candidatus Paceibacterota bacterium]